jgi:tetratricopeptide (TPR) repeat protein
MPLATRSALALSSLLAAATLAGCSSTGTEAVPPTNAAQVGAADPLAAWTPTELGHFHRAVTTSSPQAQRWFDMGLVLCFGFDQEVARLAFARAIEADPNCAMAHWGFAYAHGPHINNMAMDDDASRIAHEAAQRALALAANTTPVERALAEALTARYADPPPADRAELDRAFAAAMRGVWRAFPEDDDVGALFAEALMNLWPWDLWSKDGEPRPDTPEVLATLETVLARQPDHPGAAHYYIHAVEASPQPERAVPAAEALCARIPGASHLVHMPSHIFVRVGRYADAVDANARAVLVDEVRVARHGAGGFYAIYRAHNHHFLMWAAMFDGQRAVALRAARDTVEQLPPDFVDAMAQYVEAFIGSPYHVMVRFGMWEEMLAEPLPPEQRVATRAMYHYARALSFASLARVDEALAEQALFEAAVERVPESYTMGNNTVRDILEVARCMVRGEVEYRRGNVDVAFEHLREAVRRDDALRYDEPWGWVQPARHALAALLLEQGRLEEAEAVHRADLERHPANGWSLRGLVTCLERRGARSEAVATRAAFDAAWQRADVEIAASCFCARGL